MTNDYIKRGPVTAILLKNIDGTVRETLIDTSDLEKAMAFPNTWFLHKKLNGYYAVGNMNKKTVLLHRWITNAPQDRDVDHINHDCLDNRRSANLRILTHAENHQNRKGIQSNNSSGIRGVCWNKKRNKWEAKVIVKRRTYFVGYFDDLDEASQSVRKARSRLMPYSKDAKGDEVV